MKNGYIKLHRKLLDNPFVMKDNDYFAVWVYLLLAAAHTEIVVENCSKSITLKQGQLITGREELSKKLGVSNSKINRILNLFESAQMIEQIKKPRKGRIITVLNWDKYQDGEQINEQIMDKFRTNNGQIVYGNKNDKNDKNDKNNINNNIINNTHNNINNNINNSVNDNINNINNINNNINNNNINNTKEKSELIILKNAVLKYSPNKKIQEMLYNFITMRKQKNNPFTEYSFSEFLKRLDTLADNDSDKAAILQKSIIAGYPNIYPLPKEERSKTKNDDADEYRKIGWA